MVTLNKAAYRHNTLWVAAWIHRVSGVLLAVFLPLHFLVLGLAIEGEAKLDGFLVWTANPMVKVAEFGLVFLLAVHFLGGLRVLVIENLPWRENQKQLALGGFVVAALIAVFFFLTLL